MTVKLRQERNRIRGRVERVVINRIKKINCKD